MAAADLMARRRSERLEKKERPASPLCNSEEGGSDFSGYYDGEESPTLESPLRARSLKTNNFTKV